MNYLDQINTMFGHGVYLIVRRIVSLTCCAVRQCVINVNSHEHVYWVELPDIAWAFTRMATLRIMASIMICS